MSESETRVALRVLDPGKCSSLRPGSVMVFRGHGLELERTSAACIECLLDIYPLVIRKFLLRDPESELPALRVPCAFKGCGARFELVPAPEPTPRILPKLGAVETTGTFLSRLPEEETEVLMAVSEPRRLDPGVVFIENGTVGTALYVIRKGTAEVFLPAGSSSGSGETILATLGEGECVGEISLLTGQPATAGVRSGEGCELLEISRSQLENLLECSPVLNRIFTQILYQRFCRINRDMSDERSAAYKGKLSSVSLTDVLQNVSQSRRTGVLWILNGDQLARAGFETGVPNGFALIDVSGIPANDRFKTSTADEAPAESGIEAFYGILGWNEGEFRFVEDDTETRGRLQGDLTSILMEGARRMDESRVS